MKYASLLITIELLVFIAFFIPLNIRVRILS